LQKFHRVARVSPATYRRGFCPIGQHHIRRPACRQRAFARQRIGPERAMASRPKRRL